jgi:putative hydrolase of the HAD superfamily
MATLAVFFDAAGTLIKPTNSVGQSYASIAENYGMRVAPAELFNRFRVCFDGAAPLAFPGAAPDTIAALFAYFARPESWELYPEAIETLRALSERGLQLAVVSNFDSRLRSILEGLGAASWFDGIFISSAVGYAKPDRRIFDFVIKSRQLVATNVLHVGDSVTNDIGGATNAGVKAILVDRKGAHEADTIPRVASLNEILVYLD